MHRTNSPGFFLFLFIFISFVIFLYGPIISIVVLSFQGPSGGLTFPLNGFSIHWFRELWNGSGLVDIGASFRRSIKLGIFVMLALSPLFLGKFKKYKPIKVENIAKAMLIIAKSNLRQVIYDK